MSYLIHHWFNWPGAGERHAIIGSNDGGIANPNYFMVITETCVIKWLLFNTDGGMLFQRYIVIWSLWKHVSYDDLVNFNVGGNELITPVDWPGRSGYHLPLGGDTLSDTWFDWQVVGRREHYRIHQWPVSSGTPCSALAESTPPPAAEDRPGPLPPGPLPCLALAEFPRTLVHLT